MHFLLPLLSTIAATLAYNVSLPATTLSATSLPTPSFPPTTLNSSTISNENYKFEERRALELMGKALIKLGYPPASYSIERISQGIVDSIFDPIAAMSSMPNNSILPRLFVWSPPYNSNSKKSRLSNENDFKGRRKAVT